VNVSENKYLKENITTLYTPTSEPLALILTRTKAFFWHLFLKLTRVKLYLEHQTHDKVLHPFIYTHKQHHLHGPLQTVFIHIYHTRYFRSCKLSQKPFFFQTANTTVTAPVVSTLFRS